MKTMILKITGISLLVLVSIVVAAPYLLQEKITELIKAQCDKELRAHVNFSGTQISFFRHFPKLSIALNNLQITCVGEFQDDTLLIAKQADLTCNLRNFISGHGIRVNSISIEEPHFHAVVHRNGHANWNIAKNVNSPVADSSSPKVIWALQRYNIHKGKLEYLNEKNNLHVLVENLDQEAQGPFYSDSFTFNSKTTSDAVDINFTGAIHYRLCVKTNMEIAFHVDSKTHTYSFNTDQVSFNDLKFHTEGFFQWINDSSYNMNIRYKVPSTNFKNILSMLPSVYQKDFSTIESKGQVNFNGLIKGKYDEKHFPGYHANLYVVNGYFKYPDLSIPVEHINFGLQINNPDGVTDHAFININNLHAEIGRDTLDMHLLLKNLKSNPFIDFAIAGRLNLSNISKWMKLDSATHVNGLIKADLYARGDISEKEKRSKNKFQSSGDLRLTEFSYGSTSHSGEWVLHELLMTLNPTNIDLKELNGDYGPTHISAIGTLDNFYDFAFRSRPLKATMDVKADEMNLRDWMTRIPDDIECTISAEAEKLHYDNLDLQNIHCNLLIADQTIHIENLKARGLDGDISLDGTYSTAESQEHPDISFIYDVKGLDIQKTFLAFNTIRRIAPVAKFMTGNIDAHMTLAGKMNSDMTMDLGTAKGEGNVLLVAGNLKDFGPVDKLLDSLDISALKDIPLTNASSTFSFQGGRVFVNPFFVQTKDMEMDIEGTHGFDQSLDYDVSLKVPRTRLGAKGKIFVKNVVEQAAEKGIPLNLRDAVRMDIKMGGTINNPMVKPDMDAEVSNAAIDLKNEVNDFVHAKLDSARLQLHHSAGSYKKSTIIQTSYKSGSNRSRKKISRKTHKTVVHSKKSSRKKKSLKNYTTHAKKDRSTASN